jgi:Ribosomal protein L11 methyltransferase (PrmA)
MMSVTLPELADVDCPALQLAALGAQIHLAIRAAVGGTCDERALDARLIEFMSAPSIGQAQAAALFGHDVLAALMRHGVLAPAPDDRICARFALRLVNGSLIITDLPSDRPKLPELYVDPLWESASLARMLVDADGGDALDMGSGSGVLSLALASGSRHVYGADLNPRAQRCAERLLGRNVCSLRPVRRIWRATL